MKKLLMSSIVLFLFSASIMMFQMSCKKDALADPLTNTSQVGKIIYGKAGSGTYGLQVWISNYDGSDSHQVNIVPPANSYIATVPKLSPDGKTMFFNTESITKDISGTPNYAIYSCNVDGSGVKLVASSTTTIAFGGAY